MPIPLWETALLVGSIDLKKVIDDNEDFDCEKCTGERSELENKKYEHTIENNSDEIQNDLEQYARFDER